MNSASYSGPATITLGSETLRIHRVVIHVHQLTADIGGWGGYIVDVLPRDWVGAGTITLPDGRSGAVVHTSSDGRFIGDGPSPVGPGPGAV